MFVDCYSRYTILVPASNHTANTVSDALLRHVVPYFGTPRRLLSDRGREFVGEVWSKLTRSLGIQRLLTSPYHPEGNSINERSHKTINNMLRARLLDGVPSRTWADKIPGIMLALNAMAHEPHGFSAPMIATGREPTLLPDLEGDACASQSLDDPASYVEGVKKRLTLTHQQMTPPPAPVTTNPYREGSLIFAMTTPPERTNKPAPRWKGPFVVRRIPNPYQVTYEDGSAWRTIHINHAKTAKLPATGFPAPMPIPEPPRPALGYLPRIMQRPLPRQQPPPPPPQPAAPAEGSPAPAAASPAATPLASRQLTHAAAAANRNSAPRSEQPPPTAPARANENSRPGHQLRHSARLTPRACTIKGPPPPSAPQSLSKKNMARTYPLSLAFNQCLGSKEDPYSFSSVHLEDLHSGDMEYLVTVQQLVDAIPKTMDPTSRFALRGQVTPTGHQRLRHSMRAALWWLLPSDGLPMESIIIWHARDGGVVLRGGDVTHPLYESHMHWIPDPTPPPPRRTGMDYSDTPVQPSDTPVQSRDICVNPCDTQVKSCNAHAKSRTSPVLPSDTQASAIATSASSGAPLALPHPRKSRRRRRRRNRRSTNENSAPRSAAPVTPDERWANHNSVSQRATQHQSEASDPTQMKSAPVYKGQSIHSSHLTQPPIPATNRNSAFPFGLERCEFPGLYKPALPELRQDLTADPYRVNNSGSGLSSPSLLQPCTKPFSGWPARPQMTCPTREAAGAIRERPGIVYPLLPRAQRPDTSVAIEAALSEAAAVGRQALPPTVVDIGNTSQPQPAPSIRRRASR